LLLLQLAVAQLTFDADNRSTGIRVALAGIFWLSMGWLGYATLFVPGARFDAEMWEVYALLACLHWFVFGLFMATEPDHLSRRVRRSLPRFGLFRLLIAPLLPGGSRGYLFVCLHLAALWLIMAGELALQGTSPDRALEFVAGLCLYLVIYLGFGAALGRWGRAIAGDFRPMHARVLVLLLAAMAAIAPYLIWFAITGGNGSTDHLSILFITEPFTTLARLSDSHLDSDDLLLALAALAALTLLINSRAFVGGVVEVARGKRGEKEKTN